MVTTNQIPGMTDPSAHTGNGLLVLLAAMTPEHSESVLAKLTASFPTEDLLVASPDALSAGSYPSLRFVPAPAPSVSWTLTAADFVNAHHLAEANGKQAILMLSPGSESLSSSALCDLANAVLSSPADLAVPRYDLPPHAGLVNSAILYPLTRALFASPVRFPLAVDLGLSLRMAERLAGTAHRFTASSQGETPLWPVNEAKVAGFTINQFDVGARVQAQPVGPDLNTILPVVAGALFSDIETKAAFWQRSRPSSPAGDAIPMPPEPGGDAPAEIGPMIQAFRLAYTNLQEIWSLVLPPNSLLGLKRLSATDAAAFRMSDSLWARIVYDFLLAYRLRIINRGHLLGGLIPLYLAWAASHINITASATSTETHIEAVAAAFEAEKTYLVSRWRWPDRFNP
jgi:glucosylglycerate synthase